MRAGKIAALACLVFIIIIVPAAYAQRCTNNGRMIIICERTADTKPAVKVPESMIARQYVFTPWDDRNYGGGNAAPPSNWGSPQVTIGVPTVTYSPKYYGSFVPLTPDGPLVNSAFVPRRGRR